MRFSWTCPRLATSLSAASVTWVPPKIMSPLLKPTCTCTSPYVRLPVLTTISSTPQIASNVQSLRSLWLLSDALLPSKKSYLTNDKIYFYNLCIILKIYNYITFHTQTWPLYTLYTSPSGRKRKFPIHVELISCVRAESCMRHRIIIYIHFVQPISWLFQYMSLVTTQPTDKVLYIITWANQYEVMRVFVWKMTIISMVASLSGNQLLAWMKSTLWIKEILSW